LKLYEYDELKEIKEKSQLYQIYEMNKVIDSDDEVNSSVKRVPRTKEERELIIKPWQNELMASFLNLLF
jgi:hypothetical protein